MKKIIAVFGATGAQGGGLAHAILADKNSEFSVRAVTRDANSDKAKALAALGAEIVVADIDDKASLEKAFAGVQQKATHATGATNARHFFRYR